MCDAITQGETIKREIYVALAAKAKVLVALKHIATDHPTGIALSIAQWFDDRPLSALDFSHETLAGLNNALSIADNAIRDETKTHFICDEHDMSGGHDIATKSALGDELTALRSDIRDLLSSTAKVVGIMEAQQIYDTMVDYQN